MSEPLSPYQILKFENEIHIGSHSPNLQKRFSDNVHLALTIHVNNRFVKELGKAKNDFSDFSYVKILNTQLHFYQLLECNRIENRLYSLCKKIENDYRNKNGRKRMLFHNETHKIAIFEYELRNVKDMDFQLREFQIKNVKLEKESAELFDELKNAKVKIMKLEEENFFFSEKMRTLNHDNKKLYEYIKILEDRCAIPKKYTCLDSLHGQQKYRTIKELKTKLQKALWFAECYGLTPDTLKFKTNLGSSVKLDFTNDSQNQNYDNLSVEDKQKLKNILYTVDKFCISDAAYHELTFYGDDMPKSYLIKQCRGDINNLFHIERTPGNVPGAFVNLQTDIQSYFQNKPLPCEKIKIKICGDGSRVNRISNFVVISYSFLNESFNVSADQQRVIAVVNCNENYCDLEKACRPIFSEINNMNSDGFILINDKKIDIEINFVGDMKFVQIILGLNGSLANYSCPWCKIHKDDRQNFQKPWDFYHEKSMIRTLSGLSVDYLSNQFGAKFKPLLKVEPCKFIPDELHLFLRIADILLRNLIEDARNLDQKNKIKGEKSQNLEDLVHKIRECGVTFSVWTPKDKGGEIEWTNLTGSDYKLLFERLPDKLFFLIHHDTHEKTVKLWKDFFSLHQYICHQVHEFSNVQNLFEKCREWANLFLELGASRKGYSNITPYIHTLVYHVPWFVSKYGQLSKYSGQATEKVNDQIKTIHHKKTNKHDATVDALKTRKRIEHLQNSNCKREKRKYDKNSDLYWGEDIRKQRSAKKLKILKEIETAAVDSENTEPADSYNFDQLSIKELRKILLEKFDVKSNLRKKDKLIELVKKYQNMTH